MRVYLITIVLLFIILPLSPLASTARASSASQDQFTRVTEGAFVNDGGLDLFVANPTNNNGNNALYMNNGNENNWINIKCTGTVSNLSAIGTKVKIKATIDGSSVRQLREITSQSGFCGQNSMNTHFGSGVYFYRVTAEGQSTTRKMILVK